MTVIINGTDNSASTPAVTGTDGDTGMFYPAANTVALSTSGSERMRVDSSGNVCVGSTAAGNAGALNVSVGLAGTTAGGIQLWSSTTAAHSIQWGDGTSSTDPYRGYIEYAHNGDSMRFATQSTERMRIDSSGNVLIGTTTFGGALTVEKAAAGAGTIRGTNTTNLSGAAGFISLLGSNCNNTSSYQFIGSISGTGDVIYIYGNGNIQNANNSYGGFSDVKLKENIVDATPKLDDLMRVQVRHYNFIGDEQKQIGVVAQELEQVFPGMVDNTPDRNEDGTLSETTTKTVKYSVFVPMLIKAIQELSAKNDALEARIAALEGAE
jgi:hypothetical protein